MYEELATLNLKGISCLFLESSNIAIKQNPRLILIAWHKFLINSCFHANPEKPTVGLFLEDIFLDFEAEIFYFGLHKSGNFLTSM